MEYCLFYGNTNGPTWSSAGFDDLGNNLAADPLYYDKHGVRNYRLWDNSPAHNSGTNLTAYSVTNDIEGVARPAGYAYDRGAYVH